MMGQREVLEILKKNPNRFFPADEIKRLLSINLQTAYSVLNKLSKSGDIEFKEILPRQGPPRKLYAYVLKDKNFETIVQEFRLLRGEERFGFFNSDVLATLMLTKEIRELKEEIKNGSRK